MRFYKNSVSVKTIFCYKSHTTVLELYDSSIASVNIYLHIIFLLKIPSKTLTWFSEHKVVYKNIQLYFLKVCHNSVPQYFQNKAMAFIKTPAVLIMFFFKLTIFMNSCKFFLLCALKLRISLSTEISYCGDVWRS